MRYKIFIINLARSPERYQQALAQLAQWPDLPVERIDAADGRVMSAADIAQYYSASANQRLHHKTLKAGEKGAFISHIRCWQQIVAQQLDFALILEDDFLVDGDLPALLSAIAAVPTPWHLLKLAMPNKQQKIIASSPGTPFQLVHFQKNPISAVAQAVSLAGAKLLLEREVPFGRPVDVAMQYSWQLGFQAMGLWPLIFKPDLGFDSTIAGKQNDQVKRSVFYWRRLEFIVANLWHNLKTYGPKALLRARKWPNSRGSTRLSN
ncbi:glycosyltransferase family 25 protein [Alishewanella sp. 16-MA]|uniref:Glycosyltransferase family 25 protein n=1 Tax=Alishewanella maricola TaxID=2795740 RepID=A0ABS8C1T8_9ALTE|nr:glycosyltransferase family 25 protein [Alishewanella maricola]MCB5226291.1 glycosyltransferase family 25 protein [Alishewanella maricola]